MKSLLTLLIAIMFSASSSSAATPSYTKVSTDQPVVALTFDDGPNGPNMAAILDILAEHDAKATFYLVGKNVTKEPELVKRTLAEGHELGNHTMTHPHLPKLESDKKRSEIVELQALIQETAGVTPVTFRAPYIDYDDEVLEILGEMNLPAINANRSVGDWQGDITVEKIISRATNGVQAGDIILMHSWSDKSKAALPEIFAILKEKGLRCVTVSELLASAKEPA